MKKASILKLIFLIIVLVAIGILVYINFIKSDKVVDFATENETLDVQTKFNLDIFDNEIFKSLVGAKELNTSTIENMGRSNPFLKY